MIRKSLCILVGKSLRFDQPCQWVTGLQLANPTRRLLTTTEGPPDDDIIRRQRLNRLLYHAKQRGWLELDLILGQWAEKNLEHLSAERLDDFEELLGIENPDVFKCLTGQIEPGHDLQRNPVFQMIRETVQERMDEFSSVVAGPDSGTTPKEWVRGWNDGHPI